MRASRSVAFVAPILRAPAGGATPAHAPADGQMTRCVSGRVMASSPARTWTTSREGRTCEFALREKMRFHNGDVMTVCSAPYDDVRPRRK